MNVVSFPGLGLEFTLNRVAIELFGRPIYWYGVIIATGLLLAVYLCSKWSGRFGITEDQILDMMLFAVPAALVSVRAYYVIFNLSAYQKADGSLDWGAILRYSDGGLAIYGAIISSAIVLLLFCRTKKISFLAFADLGVHGLLIGQLIGRWGNFMNVEAFGGVTDVAWRMCSPAVANYLYYSADAIDLDVYHQILDGTLGVHPTFFYESLWNLIGFFLLLLLAKKGRKFNGQIFLSYVIWYGVGRTIIEGLRTDSLYFFNTGLRTSQLVGIISALAALIFMIVRFKTAEPATPPIPRPVKKSKKSEEISE